MFVYYMLDKCLCIAVSCFKIISYNLAFIVASTKFNFDMHVLSNNYSKWLNSACLVLVSCHLILFTFFFNHKSTRGAS